MPKITLNEANEQTWGRGLERLRFHDAGQAAREWRSGLGLPTILDEGFMSTAPQDAIKIIRSASLYALITGLSVKDSSLTMQMVEASKPKKVKKLYKEHADFGKTENVVVPIQCAKGGDLEIVVNPAFGVGWRLCQKHAVAKALPQMKQVRNIDDLIYLEENLTYKDHYIDPGLLARLSPADPKQLAERISHLLEQMLAHRETKFSLFYRSAPEESHGLGIEIMKHGMGKIGFTFLLDDKTGLKSVESVGYYDPSKAPEDLNRIGQEAIEIGKIVKSFF